MSLISDAAAAAVRAWLEGQKTLKGASDNTIEAYRRDVLDFVGFMAAHSGAPQGLAALARITVSDMRAWMAA
ncbi:MAG TPA: site-specific integrase, partial [Paracoccaceae bacterium]|nr:site-specific integrase [Paracoccaceae bacterium]